MPPLINKIKDKLHSDNKTEQPEGTHRPQSSQTANAADPPIDSDRDRRENLDRTLSDMGGSFDARSKGSDLDSTATDFTLTGMSGSFDARSKSSDLDATASTRGLIGTHSFSSLGGRTSESSSSMSHYTTPFHFYALIILFLHMFKLY
ncbi:hypothetical protein GGI35DRAFT_436682 [Trichoderma velutinum]